MGILAQFDIESYGWRFGVVLDFPCQTMVIPPDQSNKYLLVKLC